MTKKKLTVEFRRSNPGHLYKILRSRADERGWADVSKIEIEGLTRKQFAAELRALSHYGLYRAGGYVLS